MADAEGGDQFKRMGFGVKRITGFWFLLFRKKLGFCGFLKQNHFYVKFGDQNA